MKQFTTPEQGFRDFDLPRQHLEPKIGHFVPARAIDPIEIVRRRDMNPGSLLAECQLTGIRCASKILEIVTDEEGLPFTCDILGQAGLNTAWYSYAERAHDVMRRRLHLPILAHARARNPDFLIEDAVEGYQKAETCARKLKNAIEHGVLSEAPHQRNFGRIIGNTSLRLACYEPAVSGELESAEGDDIRLQDLARKRALELLESARDAYLVMHAHPSIAQLSDPYSPLAVYWYNNAPGSARSAVQDALLEIALIN